VRDSRENILEISAVVIIWSLISSVRGIRLNATCHTYGWVITHVRMRHVTRMNTSCHTHACDMSHVWMRHVTRMTVSYKCAQSGSILVTCVHEKKPEYVNRDRYLWQETYICEKRPKYVRPIYAKRDLCMWKDTETCQKSPVYVKRYWYMWKETYVCKQRHVCVKRNLCV